MTEETPENDKSPSHNKRSTTTYFWYVVGCLGVVVFIDALVVIGIPLSEGWKHQRISYLLVDNYEALVKFSHYGDVTLPAVGHARFMGPMVISKSTLPDWIEKSGLALIWRRADRVTITKDDPAVVGLISELPTVESIIFYSKPVTGKSGFQEQDYSNLLTATRAEKIYLQSQKLPDKEIPWLNHEYITWLSVARTRFSNLAIKNLPANLEYFDATRTRINDQGLDQFLRLKKLKQLKLRRTPTSKEKIEELRQKMPWCKIDWRPLET